MGKRRSEFDDNILTPNLRSANSVEDRPHQGSLDPSFHRRFLVAGGVELRKVSYLDYNLDKTLARLTLHRSILIHCILGYFRETSTAYLASRIFSRERRPSWRLVSKP